MTNPHDELVSVPVFLVTVREGFSLPVAAQVAYVMVSVMVSERNTALGALLVNRKGNYGFL